MGQRQLVRLSLKIIKNSLKIVTLIVISIRAYQHENRNKTVASHDPLCGLPFDPSVWLTYSVKISEAVYWPLQHYTTHLVMWAHNTHRQMWDCGRKNARERQNKANQKCDAAAECTLTIGQSGIHWSHFPQFTESWALVMNTQDVEVYWERWDRPKGILHLHSVTGFDFGSWKQILITVPNKTERNIKWRVILKGEGACGISSVILHIENVTNRWILLSV